MRTVPVHYLRPNDTVWTPPVVACFDTETRWVTTAAGETHTLRCWAAQLVVRRDPRKRIARTAAAEGTEAAGLARVVDDWSAVHPVVWVYAHNLGFDLAVSGLAILLCEDGWTVTEFAIDSPAPFIRLARGRSRLTLADSFSWLGVSLERVAADLGTAKFPLPANSDTMESWLARCRRDTAILTGAMTALMDWWDENQLGRWSLTGTASGWNAMRHIIDGRRITINPGHDQVTADRAAIYGGRRGVWRTGPLPPGRYAELDFTAAYPTVAAGLPLPHERMTRFASLPLDHRYLTSDRHGVIARVRLRTGTPRWPARCAGRVWYPVGEFTTILAGPDIAEAARLGALVEVGPGWMHRLGFALAPWARWVLDAQNGSAAALPAVAGEVMRHWGRAIIGKWAQRGFTTVPIGPAPAAGWWATEGWNHTAAARAVIVDFGGTRWQATADGDPDNCYPAVLAWVEAYVRVRLGRLIDAIPRAALISCDTDGLIADTRSWEGWQLDRAELDPLTVRVKRSYARVEVFGPQHLILDGDRRFAGVPASAAPQPDGTLHALLWPKLPWQMGHGQPGAYVRPAQTYRISGTYAPGWVLSDGQVAPVEMRPRADGGNQITYWPDTAYAVAGAELAGAQNRDLEGYRDHT